MRRYNLPLNNKYDFIEITDSGEGNFNTCDNCGNIIRYIAHIKDSNNKHYFVGTECVKTLQEANISNEFSMLEQIRAFKKVASANNLLSNNDSLKIFHSESFAVLVGYNKNKKPVKMAIERQYDPFKECYYSFVDSFLNQIKNIAITDDWCFNDIFNYHDKLKKRIQNDITRF